jgi:hypothetical protein
MMAWPGRAMQIHFAGTAGWKWLPDMDLNHDKQIQSLLCYRYTIGQNLAALKLGFRLKESRLRRALQAN